MEKWIYKLNATPMLWISGLFLLASFIPHYILPLFNYHFVLPIDPAWVSILISGIPLAYTAIFYLFKGKITSALLITIAMIAAVTIGDIFAAGEVAFIMAIGEVLEERTVARTKKGITALFGLMPDVGRKLTLQADGTTTETLLPAKELLVDDIIRILPGERFAADGVIVNGSTSVDQSVMTGESLPVDKTTGDTIFAGTINQFGAVDVRVTKAFADSSLQKMIQMITDAEQKQAPTQRIVDRWASILVPTACGIAIVTYLVFAFLLSMPEEALIRAVTVLVVFCPCALALATPTSIMAAIGQATKFGVLIKSGEALELMGRVDTVAFDKTGTLTHGKLTLSDIIPLQGSKETLLQTAASLETLSEHPIGKAIATAAKTQNLSTLPVAEFSMQVGKGIYGMVANTPTYCGNEVLVSIQLQDVSDAVSVHTNRLRDQGKAVVLVADEHQILGVLGLSDTVKPTAKAALATLADAGIGQTILLTGDNEKAARYLADQVGIQSVKASLLPEDKVAAIEAVANSGANICMVGDGVNDAPALKTATVGIAMGSMGSDIAIEAADIALLGDDLEKISYLKKLSNLTVFNIKFNITLAMAINFAAIVLSILGLLNPATGALVHNAGSVLVVLNAARLYDRKVK